MTHPVCVYLGKELSDYHFGEYHPFGPERYPAFIREFKQRQLQDVVATQSPVSCNESDILMFHDRDYVDTVRKLSETGSGFLDAGDTPARIGIYEAACYVVGTTLDGIDRIMRREYRHVFTPIGGLHHARRNSAAGFCVFNDCGIAIEKLLRHYKLNKIAYVDIDAHHGDGVFYSFEDEPALCFVDFHEDGRYLYPGTGASGETGTGIAKGTKLNIPMPMYADDELFFKLWDTAEQFIRSAQPEFILLQCGADSLKGDPITHLHYTSHVHAHVAERLCKLANEVCQGRVLAMGGGGYELKNLATAWNDVVEAMAGVAA